MALTIDDFLNKLEGPPPERIYHTEGDLVPMDVFVVTDAWQTIRSDARQVLTDRIVAASAVLLGVEDDDDRPEALRLQVFATHKRAPWEAFDAEMKAPSYDCAVDVGGNAHGVLKVTTEGKGVLFLMQHPCFWPKDLPHTSRPCVRLSSDERLKVLNAMRLVYPKLYQVYHPHVLSTLCRLFEAQWVPSSRPTVKGTSKPSVFVKDLRLVFIPTMQPEIEWCFSAMGCSQAFVSRGLGAEGAGRMLPRSEWGETGTEDRQLCRMDVADHFDKARAELKTQMPAHALRSMAHVHGFLELSKCFKDKVLRPPTQSIPTRRPFPLLQPRMASGGAASTPKKSVTATPPTPAPAPARPKSVAHPALAKPKPPLATSTNAKSGTSAAAARANALTRGPLSDSEESEPGDFLMGQVAKAKAAAVEKAAAKAPAPAPAPAPAVVPAAAKPPQPKPKVNPKPQAAQLKPAVVSKPPQPPKPPKPSKKRKHDSDDEEDGEHAPGDVTDMSDTSEEDEDDSDDEDDEEDDGEDGDGSEDDSNEDDDAEEYDDGDEEGEDSEEDRPARERNNKRLRVLKGAASTESSRSSESSSSRATVAPVPQPPAVAGLSSAELQELTAPVRARVAKWQERSALSIPATARERVDQYVQVLATGTSSAGIVSAFTGLCDVFIDQLEQAPPPAATLTNVERDNVQALSRSAGTFAKGTLGKVRELIEGSKRTTAALETVLQNGEDVLKTNIAVLEAFGRRTGDAAPAASQPAE